MSKIEFRPTVAGDVAALVDEPLPHRIQSITMLVDGEIAAIGGLGFRPDGVTIAFAHFTRLARRFPRAVHRAGMLGMELIRKSGVPLVVAEAQPGNPAAERWLLRFGFERVRAGGAEAFIWRRQ